MWWRRPCAGGFRCERALRSGARVDADPPRRSFRALMPVHPRLGGSMRRYSWSLLGLTLIATSLRGQGLRDKISELFIFSAGQDPLFLGGTAGSDSATALHADHFIPSARAEDRKSVV